MNDNIISSLSKVIESFEKKSRIEKEMAEDMKKCFGSEVAAMHKLLLEAYYEIDLLEEQLIYTRRRHDLAMAQVDRFEREYPLEAKALFASKEKSVL